MSEREAEAPFIKEKAPLKLTRSSKHGKVTSFKCQRRRIIDLCRTLKYGTGSSSGNRNMSAAAGDDPPTLFLPAFRCPELSLAVPGGSDTQQDSCLMLNAALGWQETAGLEAERLSVCVCGYKPWNSVSPWCVLTFMFTLDSMTTCSFSSRTPRLD